MTRTLLARWREADDARITDAAQAAALLQQVAAAPPGYSMVQLSDADTAPLTLGDLGELPPTMLTVGARLDGGVLRFVDHRVDEPAWYSAGGDNPTVVHYALMLDQDDFPPGARLPLTLIEQAIGEYLTTGRRPTCVGWQPDPW